MRERKREKCFVTVIHRRNLFAQSDGLKPLVLDEMAKVGYDEIAPSQSFSMTDLNN